MGFESFSGGAEGLTFDDVLIVPGYSEVLPSEVDISAELVPGIRLKAPVLSAAMDTVTDSRLAIAIARIGGIGIIHRNMSPEAQAAEVYKVKRSESGMISDPVWLPETATLAEAEHLMETYRISGIPVVDPQTERLVGIITNRDRRFCGPEDMQKPISEFMTKQNLVTAPAGTSIEEAKAILRQHKIEKLPLVDSEGRLKGLITIKDIFKRDEYPDAATDSRGRLLAGAAVGVGADLEERVALLASRGVDVLVVDTAHGHSKKVIDAIRRIRSAAPHIPVIAGNVVTAEGTRALIEAGASAVKVGVGAGSICTTRIISGAGMPQLSAIYECAKAARAYGIPVIADGGIRYSGDIVKAIAAGAETVMLGSLLAGLEEAPGELVLYEGRQFKSYRGMGSVGALQGYGRDRYGSGQSNGKLVPEGVEGMVPYRGKLSDYMVQMLGGLRSGMGYAGARTFTELRKARMVRITAAAYAESHPHSIVITKEAPNYQKRD
ncbi:IMP dehydrogenase [uncultured spirochete]|jgi:IMP dehydrogenase|uniref:Inosine-5'-monophosphate dehydrogenase n=1 Tax=uncultured spirochete TaxID=156406 RepID=A0A3P3XGY9_9SPIR|nr:IMP dehydrogenase [Rectinema subterraneum]SLM11329.1 IMP dehydrogenase [uncultured spirochete]HCX96805.1 IMP dehydrogenase [Spirochaetaceae bacterium]